jgi:hypothetical protein
MAKNIYDNKGVKAPLEDKSTKLKYQVAIFVPSTEMDKKVKPKVYNARVKETQKFLSKESGGDTSVKASGGYTMSKNDKYVKEDVTIVETSMSKEDYERSKPRIENYVVEKRKVWKQDTICYKFEQDMYIYPKSKK